MGLPTGLSNSPKERRIEGGQQRRLRRDGVTLSLVSNSVAVLRRRRLRGGPLGFAGLAAPTSALRCSTVSHVEHPARRYQDAFE